MRLRALLAGVLAPVVLWTVLPVGTAAAPSLSSLNQKIQSTEGEIGQKKRHEQVLTTEISAFNRRINGLQSRISTLTVKQTRLQSDLDRKRAELDRIQGELRFQRARRVRLRARLAEARRVLSRRLLELYQSDRPDLVTVILNSRGFADLLEREEFIHRIGEQDHRIVVLVRKAKADATAQAEALAVLEKRQRRLTAAVLSRRNQISQVRGSLVHTQSGYANARAQRASALSATRSERHELEGRLTNLRAEQAKIQSALNAAADGLPSLPAGPIRGGGRFIWPVNGPVTSPFCEQRAWESCHPGIDIGVPSGTPVRAAGSGTVALEQSEAASGGYGNFLCIAHTSSLSTCYAHLSSFSVGMGARVSQGQVVAISDCTGRCYGAHLHFEVRINGAVTNPLNYL